MGAEIRTISPTPDHSGTRPARANLHVVDSLTQPQNIILLPGLGVPSYGMAGIAAYLRLRTDYNPRFMNTGLKGFFDINLGPNQQRQIPDAVKRHTDESGQPVILLGHSLGGRNGLLAVMDAHGFDPTKEVEEVFAFDSPIGDLQGLPRSDEVFTSAYFGDPDFVINRLHPFPWFRPTNEEIHRVRRAWQISHFDPMVSPVAIEAVIADLGIPSEPPPQQLAA